MKLKLTLVLLTALIMTGCESCNTPPSSSDVMRDKQEASLSEGVKSIGSPAIVNFRELRLVNDLYVLRDQNGLATYTYIKSLDNRFCYVGETIGFPIPYAAQMSAPESMQRYVLPPRENQGVEVGRERLPQAEPNGLHMPSSADATWIMLKDPNGKEVHPAYFEDKLNTLTFKVEGVPSCWAGK